jgi:hypothetical protein
MDGWRNAAEKNNPPPPFIFLFAFQLAKKWKEGFGIGLSTKMKMSIFGRGNLLFLRGNEHLCPIGI